jgi:hypothetical protein
MAVPLYFLGPGYFACGSLKRKVRTFALLAVVYEVNVLSFA